MGCCFSRRRPTDNYDSVVNTGHMGVDYFNRDKVDVSNYICQELNNVTVVKDPGQLNGQSFLIESCKDSVIYLVDYTGAVTIDVCIDCHIFIGPCKGSVFVRECKRCIIMASCQQFRARDSTQSTYLLHCTTQPVIENCSDINFACFNCYYPQLQEHLKTSNLSPFNNSWYSVHDFTPQSDNWRKLKPRESLSLFGSDEITAVTFDTNNSTCIVPITIGTDYYDESNEICVVVFLADVDNGRALQFLHTIGSKLSLLVTKDTKMKTNGIQQFFSNNSAAPSDLRDGLQVEYLLLEGSECLATCSKALHEDYSNNSSNAYSSPDQSQAIIDYHRLCHLINSGIMT